MACALTAGRSIDCRNSIGGVEAVYISNFANVTAFTEVAGAITAITQAGATNFYTYELEKENGSLVETHTGSLENGTNFYDSVLEFNTMNLTTAENQEMNLLDQARLFIIVKTNNGKYFSMGANKAADKLSGTSVTGAGFGDHSGNTYSFTAKEATRMYELSSAVFGTLTLSA